MGFYRNTRRIMRTPEEAAEIKAANAKLKAEREANTMTCQCCARKFLANMGTIAHHGYQRPGGGFQTASCIGAKHKPFEVARDRLKKHIDAQKEHLKAKKLARDHIHNEHDAIIRTTQKRAKDAWAPKEYAHITVTRDSFDGQRDELRTVHHWYGSYEELKANELDKRDREIKSLKDYILYQTGRYNGWTVTHEWSEAKGTWVKK